MLVLLKSPPTSSHWNFRGARSGMEFWSNRNGKLFAKDSAGRWYKVAKAAECRQKGER